MKTKLSKITLALALSGLLLTGCATTPGGGSSPNIPQISAVVKVAARYGVFYAVRQEPKSREYFTLAETALGALLNSGTFDPVALEATLKNIPVNELNSAEALLAVQSALEIYKSTYAEVVSKKLDEVQYLRPILQSLLDGITLGLAAEATSKAVGAPAQ